MKKKIIFISLLLCLLFVGTSYATDNFTDSGVDEQDSDSVDFVQNFESYSETVHDDENYDSNCNNENIGNDDVVNDVDDVVTDNDDSNENPRATTWYVNPVTGNDGNAGNTASAPFKTIARAITASSNGHTIFLQNGTYYSWNRTVNKNLTIKGQSRSGVIINPNQKKLFDLNAGKSLALQNLKVINANNTYGGAVRVRANSKLTVSNCQFESCTGNNGAVISCIDSNAVITISGSSFINNGAFMLGGAILNTGISSTATISNCIFTNNKMKAETYGSNSYTSGGAVYFGGQSVNSVNGCTFTGNEAFNGGAVYCSSGSTTSFANSVFTNNYARHSNYGYGGGIMVGAGSATFNALTFSGNKAKRGGAISINSGLTYTISNSKFTNNVATNYGGACNLYGQVTLQRCNFTNNLATNYGGAVFNTGTQDIININLCRFISNKALEAGSNTTSFGGAIASSGISSQITIKNSVFNTNQANRGGAISSRAEYIHWTIENNQFNNNNVSQHGGALCLLKESNTVILTKNNFTQNRANNYGGAILGDGLNSIFYITSCKFTSNTAGRLGGAIYNQKNTTISGRFNSYISNSILDINGSGGAICNKGINSKLILSQEEYRGNLVNKGSAICNYASGCYINSSIIVGEGEFLIFSNRSMDARFNWWGSNNGNISCSSLVNCQNPVVLNFSVGSVGVTNHIRTITIHVSVYTYNDSGVYKPLDKYIPSVRIVLSNNLGTITTNYQETVTKTLSDSITSITATLDNQVLRATIPSSKTTDLYSLPSQYDDIIDLRDFTITREDECITLFVDENACNLTDILNEEFSEMQFGAIKVIIENSSMKIKYNDNCAHNVSIISMYYDETLSGGITTGVIGYIMGMSVMDDEVANGNDGGILIE